MPTRQTGTVKVDGKLFARFALVERDPAKYYGCSTSLQIWPTLEPQRQRGWYDQFQRVRVAIEAHVLQHS